MIVSSSGYYATGSSAVYDLIREYSCFTTGIIGDKEYEHILFYTPGGLFDLEYKLLYGNSIHRSDEALKTFAIEMKRLNNYDFQWFGGYKKMFGTEFETINSALINSLINFTVDAHWSYHIRRNSFSFKKMYYSTKNIIKGKKVKGSFFKGYHYDGNSDILYAFPEKEKFYSAARKYIIDYAKLINPDTNKNLLLNHAVLPHNAERISVYGMDDFKVIIVDRDPRDVFAYVKYGGKARGIKSRIPTQIDDFIKFWKLNRNGVNLDSKNILCIRFEDLIYKYEQTVSIIEKFLGINSDFHVAPKHCFSPDISIQNTQIYKNCNVDIKEIEMIEKSLQEYLYDFPNIDDKRIDLALENMGNFHMIAKG